MYMIATPASRSWRTRSNSRSTAPRSRAAVGSSSSRQRVPAASARVISTTCRCSTVRLRAGGVGVHVEAPVGHDLLAACSRIWRQSTTPRRRGAAAGRGRRSPPRSAPAPPWSAGTRWRCARARRRRRPATGAGLPVEAAPSPSSGGDTCRQDRDQRGLARAVPADQAQAAAGVQARASTPRSACVLPNRLWIPAALATAGGGSAAALHGSLIARPTKAADAAVGVAVDVAPERGCR